MTSRRRTSSGTRLGGLREQRLESGLLPSGKRESMVLRSPIQSMKGRSALPLDLSRHQATGGTNDKGLQHLAKSRLAFAPFRWIKNPRDHRGLLDFRNPVSPGIFENQMNP